MKKSMVLIALVTAVCAAMLFVGCGNDQSAAPADTNTQQQTAETAAPPQETTTAAPETTTAAPAGQTGGITDQKALEIALQHAGVAQADASRIDAHLDYDDDYGKQVFDVEFHVGTMEYSYDIDPETGEILKYESDIDDD